MNIKMAQKRIMREFKDMNDFPSPYYSAAPLDDNQFEFHFTYRGLEGTCYENGLYHGKLLLNSNYPYSPPDFIMLTPSGRFETHTKICLSISAAYHPEHWQPTITVGQMIEAIRHVSGEDIGGLGSIVATEAARKKLAEESLKWTCSTCGICNELLLPSSTSTSSSSSSSSTTSNMNSNNTNTHENPCIMGSIPEDTHNNQMKETHPHDSMLYSAEIENHRKDSDENIEKTDALDIDDISLQTHEKDVLMTEIGNSSTTTSNDSTLPTETGERALNAAEEKEMAEIEQLLRSNILQCILSTQSPPPPMTDTDPNVNTEEIELMNRLMKKYATSIDSVKPSKSKSSSKTSSKSSSKPRKAAPTEPLPKPPSIQPAHAFTDIKKMELLHSLSKAPTISNDACRLMHLQKLPFREVDMEQEQFEKLNPHLRRSWCSLFTSFLVSLIIVLIMYFSAPPEGVFTIVHETVDVIMRSFQ